MGFRLSCFPIHKIRVIRNIGEIRVMFWSCLQLRPVVYNYGESIESP
jgi:hypothetical protein